MSDLEQPGWADPTWEGHTHTWPEILPEDDLAVIECADCGLPAAAGDVRAAQAT